MTLFPPPGSGPQGRTPVYRSPSRRAASWRRMGLLVAAVIGGLAVVFIGIALTMSLTPAPVPQTLPVPPAIPTAPELSF